MNSQVASFLTAHTHMPLLIAAIVKDVLERNRRNIANEVSLILSKNEKELRRRLDEARCSFMIDRPCSELKQKDVLLGSFNADSASAPAAGCGHDLEQGKTLALIMKDLQHNYRFHRKGLKKLWKDWHKVQRKIACLGIEVLGSCRLDIVQASKQSGRKRNLRTTTLSRKKWEEAKAEYDSFIRNETGKVKDMSRNAIAKSRTQTKVRVSPALTFGPVAAALCSFIFDCGI